MNVIRASILSVAFLFLSFAGDATANDFTLLHEVKGSFSKKTGVDSEGRYYRAYSIHLDPQYTYMFKMSLPPNERASFFAMLRILDDSGKCVGRSGSMLKYWPEKAGKYQVVISAYKPAKVGKFILSANIKKATNYVFEESWKTSSAIDSLKVEENADFQPGGGKTYCNKFAVAVAKNFGAPLPEILSFERSNPRWLSSYYNAKEQREKQGTTYELNANMMQDWLADTANGWKPLGEAKHEEAQRYANRGYLVMATWKNPASAWKSGHITVLRAHEFASFDSNKGPRIAQAGKTNFSSDFLSSGFGATKRPKVQYFVHQHQLTTWVPKPGETGVDIKKVKSESFGAAEHRAGKGKSKSKTPPKSKSPKTPPSVSTAEKVVESSNLDILRAKLDQLRNRGRKTSGLTPVGNKWIATTESAKDEAKQETISTESFQDLLKKTCDYRNRNWMIRDIDFDGTKWAAVMEESDSKFSQRVISGKKIKEITDKIKRAWKLNQRVTSITHGKSSWIAVVTKSSKLKGQAYSAKKKWSDIEPWIKEQWKKKRDISSAAYHNGTWIIVMTEMDQAKSQQWVKRKSSDDLKRELEIRLPEGYEVDLITGGKSGWVAVLSRTKE